MKALKRIIISLISVCMTIGLITASSEVYAIGNDIIMVVGREVEVGGPVKLLFFLSKWYFNMII